MSQSHEVIIDQDGYERVRYVDDTPAWLEETARPDYVDRLKAALKARPMTQAEFARLCHCSPSRISALLNRRYCERTPRYIWRVAKNWLKV